MLRTVAILRRKVLLLFKEWMLVRAKIKTWLMQSHPLSFLPAQILHLSSFCLWVHSYIPLPSHLPIDSHPPSLSVSTSFSFSLPLGFCLTHSISPLPDPSTHFPSWWKNSRETEEKIEGKWRREGVKWRRCRKGAERCTFSPRCTTEFWRCHRSRAPKICSSLPGSSTWQ